LPLPVQTILDVLWIVFREALGSVFHGPMKYVRGKHCPGK
jgi:hypothetical protein